MYNRRLITIDTNKQYMSHQNTDNMDDEMFDEYFGDDQSEMWDTERELRGE